MWIVSGRLVLATSPAEAERALVRLLVDLDGAEQSAARALLDTLRAELAAAA
jgi:hypothetical protein